MDSYRRNRHKEFFKKNVEKFGKKIQLKISDLDYLLKSLIDVLEIPFPPSEIYPYFLHPNLINKLLYEVINSEFLSPPDREEMSEDFGTLLQCLKEHKSNFKITLRILAPGGIYPNTPIERGGCKYTFNNQLPVLFTKSRNKKNIWDESSLINWLTKQELRFATSVLCAPSDKIVYFFFTSSNSISVDASCIKKVPIDQQVYFLREWLDIHLRFTSIGTKGWNRSPLPDISVYEFTDFQDSISIFNDIFDSFSITNDLLLRTCNYFVKAIMHWNNLINAEEALVNCFFCLEGCLHLIQKKFGEYNQRLNLKLLKKVFDENDVLKEISFEFIQEAYEKRISLVHAEPEWGAEWSPFITYEDFWDYFKICRILINYILIERKIDDF